MAHASTADPEELHALSLRDALSGASRRVLQSIIEDICTEIPDGRKLVLKKILVPEDRVPEPSSPEYLSVSDTSDSNSEDDDDCKSVESVNTLSSQEIAGKKRLRSRFAVCEYCEEEFDVSKNTKTSCLYHPGNLTCLGRPDEIGCRG